MSTKTAEALWAVGRGRPTTRHIVRTRGRKTPWLMTECGRSTRENPGALVAVAESDLPTCRHCENHVNEMMMLEADEALRRVQRRSSMAADILRAAERLTIQIPGYGGWGWQMFDGSHCADRAQAIEVKELLGEAASCLIRAAEALEAR